MADIPDVLSAAPDAYRVLLENEKVRVMELTLKPGQTAPMHNHPNDHAVYVMNGARFKLRFPDGRDATFDLEPGQTLWMEAGPHETENVGDTEGHNLVVEIK